jgi:hypothetical protein
VRLQTGRVTGRRHGTINVLGPERVEVLMVPVKRDRACCRQPWPHESHSAADVVKHTGISFDTVRFDYQSALRITTRAFDSHPAPAEAE